MGAAGGRTAPLGKADEFDEIDLAAVDDDGEPLVAKTAHVRLAHHSRNNGARMLRRGDNFVDGSDGLGGSTRACSSSPTSATRGPRSSRCSAAWPVPTR